MELKGSVALVTGAAKRVGRAIAVLLAQRGAAVAVHYGRSAPEARRLAKELSGKYRVEAAAFQADLSELADVRRLAREVLRRFRRLDLLVNSASVYQKTPFGRVSERDWDRHLDANLKGPFFLTQELAGALRRSRGSVVNLADWAGLRPYGGYAPYCASKAGLLCLTDSLAKALAPEVRVNAVLPGPVLLPPGLGAGEREAVRKATVLQRLGTPRDVAQAVLYLAGASFSTGAKLTVDGGRLIK